MRFIQKIFLTIVFTTVPLVLTVWLVTENKHRLKLEFGLPAKSNPFLTEEADDMFFGVLPWSEEAQDFPTPINDSGKWNNSSSSDCTKHESTCSFLVNGLGCSIPSYKPFHKAVEQYLKTVKVTCKKKSHAFAEGYTIRINKSSLAFDNKISPNHVKCTITAIKRPSVGDGTVSREVVLENFNDTHVSQNDFIEIKCHDTQNDKEIYVDFFAFVQVKKEVKKRCDEAAKKYQMKKESSMDEGDHLSLLLIGFDSMSHLNFLRRMPMSYKYLKRNMAAVELQGYTKLADNTFPCVIPMMTGKFISELRHSLHGPYDDYPLIWKQFAKRGYRTLFAEDYPWISIFNHEKKGFKFQPTDYYIRPFYLTLEGSNMRKGDGNEHCFNSRLEVGVVFDWLMDFVRLFSAKRYFAFTFFTRLFHGLMNEPQNADPVFHKFLSQANDEGILNNSVVIVFSDHGLRATKFRATPMGKYEERLPLLLISFPPWFHQKYPDIYKNLKINERRLTTLFDVHEFMKDLLELSNSSKKASLSSRGISLFREIPLERTCENAAIKPQWCMCKKYNKVQVGRKDVKESAEALVDKINFITNSERNSCAILKVQNITAAQVYTVDNEWSWFQVIFVTTPGNGLFEGTTKYNKRTSQNLATLDFSRINQYGNQSDCIHNDFLRIFCYCSANLTSV